MTGREYKVRVDFGEYTITDPLGRNLEETANKCLKAESTLFKSHQSVNPHSFKEVEPCSSIVVNIQEQ